MKCINNFTRLICTGLCAVLLCGCGGTSFDMKYEVDSDVSGFNVISYADDDLSQGFAADLCVVTQDVDISALDMSQASAAVLFDVNRKEVIYSKNAHERLHPASLTKVMTALVALKYSSLDQVLVATNSVNVNESGAQLIGLKAGDTMTMDQALHMLLMYSANDVALLIAENVGGTVDNFVELMNQEALALGATNTRFANPHGLTQDEHYTTAYDLYLIFNEAIKYDTFSEIIHMNSYQTVYYDSEGEPKEASFETTNLYLRGNYQAPENVTVIGGKTGTTNAAGHCLMLLSRDVSGSPYISVILCSQARDVLYGEMTNLLNEIPK